MSETKRCNPEVTILAGDVSDLLERHLGDNWYDAVFVYVRLTNLIDAPWVIEIGSEDRAGDIYRGCDPETVLEMFSTAVVSGCVERKFLRARSER